MTDKNQINPVDEKYAEKVGEVVIESTMLKFLSTATPDEQERFSKFVNDNASDENLIEKIGQEYPTFLTILEEEIQSLQKDIEDITSQN